MKVGTLKLCLPVVLITAQHSGIGIIIPPFLENLAYPVSAIGALFAVGPMLSLSARLPAGFAYRGARAKTLISVALVVAMLCNLAYGFAVKPVPFIIVHALNGFVMGAAMTFYLAYFVESLPRTRTATMPWDTIPGPLPSGTPVVDYWQAWWPTDTAT